MRTVKQAVLVIATLFVASTAIGASDVDLVKGRTWLCSGTEDFSFGDQGVYQSQQYTPMDPITLTFNDDPDADGIRTFSFSNKFQGLIFGTWKAGKSGRIDLQLDKAFQDNGYVPYIASLLPATYLNSKLFKKLGGTISAADVQAPAAGFKSSITLRVTKALGLTATVKNTLTYWATIKDADGIPLRCVMKAKMIEKGRYTGSAPQ